MVINSCLLLVTTVPFGYIDESLLDRDLKIPAIATTTTSSSVTNAQDCINWRPLLRIGSATHQLPDIVTSNAEPTPKRNIKYHKPDILLHPNHTSETSPGEILVEEIKVDVPRNSTPREPIGEGGGRKPFADWLRKSAIGNVKQGIEKEEEVIEVQLSRREWREAGAMLRKIGDLLDSCAALKANVSKSAPLSNSRIPYSSCCCCCSCLLTTSALGLLFTWGFIWS